MLGPYRVSAPVEPDLPTSCTARRCGAFVPHPPRFPASIGCAPRPQRALPSGFAKALSAAATTLLLVASASISAVTYSVVVRQARAARAEALPQMADPVLALPPPPRRPHAFAHVPPAGLVPLHAVGGHTHSVDELWRRAERIAATGAEITLARVSLPRGSSAWDDAGALHIVPELHKGFAGLRVLAVGDRSAPALAGVRPGDLVLTVNGYVLGPPENGPHAFTAATNQRALIAEIWRDGRRVVLRVDWND